MSDFMHAESARESARRPNGRFGSQPVAEADVELTISQPAEVDAAADSEEGDTTAVSYYHATDARLRVGSEIRSPASRKVRGKWEGKNAAGYSAEHVYIYAAADDHDFAHNLMHHHGRHHYVVQPVGELLPDPDPTAGGVRSFMATSARVVRVMKW